MKKEGTCAFGDHCPYAHNVFEYWLHPTRYRSQLCNDTDHCQRKICFFAHAPEELRVPECKPFVSPEVLAAAAAAAANDPELQQQQKAPAAPSTPQQKQHQQPQNDDGIRFSLDTLLGTSPTIIHNIPESFSQHADRMSIPSATPLYITASASPTSTIVTPMSPNSANPKATVAAAAAGGGKEGGSLFTPQEQQIVDMVVNMLTYDRLSPMEAVTILQQMIPEASLAKFQAHLLGGGTEMASASHRLQQQQQQQQPQSFAAVAAKYVGGGHEDVRMEAESDSGRSSLDRGGGGSTTPKKRSYDTATVSDLAPPPAHPQYWLQQQQQQPDQYQPIQQSSLFSVPEAFPMINAPRRSFGGFSSEDAAQYNNTTTSGVRKSTGSADLPPFPGAGAGVGGGGSGFVTKERLDREFGRLSFDEPEEGGTNTVQAGSNNPFASILYDSPSNSRHIY